jgi:hypothetical protein
VSPSPPKPLELLRIAAIAFALFGALHPDGCAAAPAELAKGADAFVIAPVTANRVAGLSGSVPTVRHLASLETSAVNPSLSTSGGPLRRATGAWTPDAASQPEHGGNAVAIRNLGRAWGPAAPVGTHIPVAHVDLWGSSRARVAVAVHHGLSLQARLIF